MSDYLHGVEIIENDSFNMTISDADISSVVVIGTSLEDVEEYCKITNFTESINYVGKNIDGLTLADAVETVLTESGGADIYPINIFDKEKHSASVDKTITFANGECQLTELGIQKLVLKKGDETLVLDTDYSFEKSTIKILAGGKLETDQSNVSASYSYADFSREQFEQQLKTEPVTDIQKAARFLYLITRSFGGKGSNFGTSKTSGIKSAGGIIERVTEVAKRLDKVLIENKNAFELIKQYDTADNFFYCDPPYSQGEGYKVCSTKEFEHEKLAKTLKNIKGRFLLSYDNSEYVKKLYKGFNFIEVTRQKGINNKNQKDRNYKELLIKNF